jgi:polyisoprenoid-binding protein YceI
VSAPAPAIAVTATVAGLRLSSATFRAARSGPSATTAAAPTAGRFSRYRGTLDLSGQPAIELTIETESLDTKHKKRDAHLRSPDFFGAEKHPHVRFVSESATLDGDRLNVRGRLHARGSSLPLELDVMLRRVGDELEIEAATHADHQHLGMTWNKLGMLRTPSRLTLKGRLVQDAA